MSISYQAALDLLKSQAESRKASLACEAELVPLGNTLGRVTSTCVLSPISTPQFDTSAMDGYAIRSPATQNASPENPVYFEIVGTVAAGDPPRTFEVNSIDDAENCVEIMTGAQFPEGVDAREEKGRCFDACVKLEDTAALFRDGRPSIKVSKPVKLNANRRFAGGDYGKGDQVIQAGVKIEPQHILGLASLGISKVPVLRKLRVGVWSTGKELDSIGDRRSKIHDSNGPYLTSALQATGIDAEYLGVIGDNKGDLERVLQETAAGTRFDVLITSGGVSKGRFDFVRSAVDSVGECHFHGVSMRPGHPVLYATIRSHGHAGTPFFGLPGNPIAAAVCNKFLVVPFVRYLQGQPPDKGIPAKLRMVRGNCLAFPTHAGEIDIFRHGSIKVDQGVLYVDHTPEQSSSKVKPLVVSNCWIHLTPRSSEDSIVNCFPMSGHLPFLDLAI